MVDRRSSRDPDLYKVLRVHTDADAAELKRAYRRQLHRLHPDKRQADGQEADPDAEERYKIALARVLHAYKVLRDPERRAAYDAERAAGSARRRQSPVGSEPRSRADGPPAPPGERSVDSRMVINLGFLRIEVDIDDLR